MGQGSNGGSGSARVAKVPCPICSKLMRADYLLCRRCFFDVEPWRRYEFARVDGKRGGLVQFLKRILPRHAEQRGLF